MKLISVIARPSVLERLASALRKAKVAGITVTRVEGFGTENRQADLDMVGYLSPRVKVETAVEDEEVDAVLHAIRECLSHAREGHAVVFVTDIDAALRIEESPH